MLFYYEYKKSRWIINEKNEKNLENVLFFVGKIGEIMIFLHHLI